MNIHHLHNLDHSKNGIIKLAMPILFALWATHLLNIINRFLLLNYSVAALNVVVLSTTYCNAITAFFYRVARIASVYTGQLNGASDYQNLSSPMWQMIYLAIFSTLFFLPITYLVPYLQFINSDYINEIIYYRRLILGSAPIFVAYTALLAFFNGRGKTKLIAAITIVGGVIRILMNYLLVYGIPNKLPALGAIGNAYAQICVKLLEFIILGYYFIAGNNYRFSFENCRFNLQLFFSCIKTGLPLALNSFLALVAWHLIHVKLSYYSTELATSWSISSSIFIFLNFASQGLGKATAISISNLIGQQKLVVIRDVYRRFILLSLFLALVLGLILIYLFFTIVS